MGLISPGAQGPSAGLGLGILNTAQFTVGLSEGRDLSRLTARMDLSRLTARMEQRQQMPQYSYLLSCPVSARVCHGRGGRGLLVQGSEAWHKDPALLLAHLVLPWAFVMPIPAPAAPLILPGSDPMHISSSAPGLGMGPVNIHLIVFL